MTTILLLEDNPGIANALKEELEDLMEASVIPCLNSTQLFESIKQNPKIDLFILDRRVQAETKYHFARTGTIIAKLIKEHIDSSVPIICISAYEPEPEEKELAKYVDVFLKKPFDSEKLISEAQRFVDQIREKEVPKISSTSTLFGSVQFSNHDPNYPLYIGESYDLAIQIRPDDPTQPNDASRIAKSELEIKDNSTNSFIIKVFGEDMQVEPNSIRKLTVQENGFSESVTFKISPTSHPREQKEIQVLFFSMGEICGEVTMTVDVLDQDVNRIRNDNPELVDPVTPLNYPSADPIEPTFQLILYSHTEFVEGLLLLPDPINSAVRTMNKQRWIEIGESLSNSLCGLEELFEFDDTGKPHAVDCKHSLSTLIMRAKNAFCEIFDDQNVRTYLRERLITHAKIRLPIIRIVSTENLIPWDLLSTSENCSDTEMEILRDVEDEFESLWGMTAIVEKLTPRNAQRQKVDDSEIDNSDTTKIVFCRNSKFKKFVEDIEFPFHNEYPSVEMEDVLYNAEHTIDDFNNTIKTLSHFYQLTVEVIDGREVELSTSLKVDPGMLFGSDIRFQSNPIVFCNGCKTGGNRSGHDRELANSFLEKGAAAYIGTEVPIRAEFASYAACEIYGELFAGNRLGLALFSFRNKLWNESSVKNPLGIVYSMFGRESVKLRNSIEK